MINLGFLFCDIQYRNAYPQLNIIDSDLPKIKYDIKKDQLIFSGLEFDYYININTKSNDYFRNNNYENSFGCLGTKILNAISFGVNQDKKDYYIKKYSKFLTIETNIVSKLYLRKTSKELIRILQNENIIG